MKKTYLFCFLFSIVCLCTYAKDEVAVLKENYVQLLVHADPELKPYLKLLSRIPPEEEVSDQNVIELQQRYPVTRQLVESLVKELLPDGAWPDLNYADTKRSGWEPKQHAERTLMLAKYHYQHPDKRVEEAIHRALGYWFRTKPVCKNWWYNQIGIPRTFGSAFLLFESWLTEAEKAEALNVMANARFGMTGQNKVWLAGNVLMRALLQGDLQLVRESRDQICSEIVLGRVEGIKPDWSFHQHGAQQQFGNYGLSFLCNMSFYAELFAGTTLALGREQMDILTSFYLKGYRWILWRGHMDVNGLNRQLFHNADIHKAFSLLFAGHALQKSVPPGEAVAIKQMIDENFLHPEKVATCLGYKHFYDSDLTIYRTPHWMASVRMASQRVIGTELINEDNLKGYYMADGAFYTYVRGDEYHNVFPYWDWRRIPGITTYNVTGAIPTAGGKEARNHSRLVGGCSYGACGLTAMELNRNGLHAKKAWFFTPDYVLCLGSDIWSERSLPLQTAVDQRLHKGKLVQEGNRYHHDNTGYLILEADTCTGGVAWQKGQWHDFMGMYKPRMLSGEVFSLTIKHRIDRPATYQYVLFPGVSRGDLKRVSPSFNVLRNDATVQAVRHEGHYYVAVYQETTLSLDGVIVQTVAPGIYIYKENGEQLKAAAF